MPNPKPAWHTLSVLLSTISEAPITTEVLCKRLKINKATLYRYIKTLRKKGAKIERYYYSEEDRRLCAWTSETKFLNNLKGKNYHE